MMDGPVPNLRRQSKTLADEIARKKMCEAEATAKRIFRRLKRKGIHFIDSAEMQAEGRTIPRSPR